MYMTHNTTYKRKVRVNQLLTEHTVETVQRAIERLSTMKALSPRFQPVALLIFLMQQPFKTAPHGMVTPSPNHEIIFVATS